jgi:hypothetical protein
MLIDRADQDQSRNSHRPNVVIGTPRSNPHVAYVQNDANLTE